jgi:hypothetical protein
VLSPTEKKDATFPGFWKLKRGQMEGPLSGFLPTSAVEHFLTTISWKTLQIQMTPFEKDASVGVITNGKERRHFPWFLKTQTRADGGSPFGVFANKCGRGFSYNKKLKSTSKRKDSILFLPKHASLPYSLARILHGIYSQSWISTSRRQL